MARTMTVTKGPWGFSSSHQLGTKEHTISVYRFHDGKRDKRGWTLQQKGDIYGLVVSSSEEATRIGLERGYLQPYSRNLTRFVMTRAARKRGIKSTDGMYNRQSLRDWKGSK
jgi:hypothetical protein